MNPKFSDKSVSLKKLLRSGSCIVDAICINCWPGVCRNSSNFQFSSLHERIGAGDGIAGVQVPQGVHKAVPMRDCHILQHEAAEPEATNGCMPPVLTPQ